MSTAGARSLSHHVFPGGPMTGRPSTERVPGARHSDSEERHEHQPFLNTYRAVAACAREFARLSDDVLEGVVALAATGIADKPVVRQAPGRCIVQLGPVALTIAWLRGAQDSIVAGELLIVVWRGSVAKRLMHAPERAPIIPAATTATELWTEVFSAEATDEASWLWRPSSSSELPWSSARLATHCVGQLQRAHAEST
jgi:hypothetical protein